MRLLDPLLINILGHAAGALIFAIFLVLLYSGRGWAGVRGRYLSGLAAALSLAWNLGSLIVLMWPQLPPPVLDIVAAISFSVLSLLPAVLLQISTGGTRRPLVWTGYLLSSVAVAMHFWEIAGNGFALHQAALLIITAGFLLLAGLAVAGSGDVTRILGSMCLALFASSFVHFGSGHASEAWSSELFVHHAGIPLALLVLLQDDRFVLLDAFVRFLANALLAAVLTALVIGAAFRLVLVQSVAWDPLHVALLLISVCVFLVVFAWLRNRVQAWLTHAVFRHADGASLAQRMRNCPELSNDEQYLEWAAACMAAVFQTRDYALVGAAGAGAATAPHAPGPASGLNLPPQWKWAEAVVPLRIGAAGPRFILLGRRNGGRRYLSEDFDALAVASADIAERVESVRRQELGRLVNQAELRALQSQMNPHFLFNALNTLYGTIPRESEAARRIVLNLADIFRYFLRSEKPFVPLSREIEIVRAYLEVEQLRLGERLIAKIDIDPAALDVAIPVLSIEPLVENAIKHGISAREDPGYVTVRARIAGDLLSVTVENSGAGSGNTRGPGLGLQNVRRRLEICYGASAGLQLDFRNDLSIAELRIPVAAVAAASRA